MSFGYAVGDFVSVGAFAYKMYDRCKASVTEFKDLSKEVVSMHIVFKAVEDYWKGEEKEGRDLAFEDKQDLKRLAEGCKETLIDLEALLQKHRALGSGSNLISRMRWAPKDIAPIRNRIVLRTTLLASFNNTITTKSNASQQRKDKAQIFEALNQIHRDFENGMKPTAAFSSVTLHELKNDNDNAWNEIAAEIQSEGVEASSVDNNRAFISIWIDKVILEETQEEDEYGQTAASPPWTPLPLPSNNSTGPLALESPQISGTDKATSWILDLATTAEKYPASCDPTGASINISHISKKSNRRLPDGPNREYTQRIFAKLLASATDEPRGQNDSLLLAKRIYHQLDWYNLGFLPRLTVIEDFRLAIQSAQIPLSEEFFVHMDAEGDTSKSSRVDQEEFIRLIGQLLTAVRDSAGTNPQREFNLADEESMKTLKETYSNVSLRTANGNILPWGFKQSQVNERVWHVCLGPARVIQVTTKCLKLDTFAIMAFAVCHVFAPMINQCVEDWAAAVLALPWEQLDEYQESVNAVYTGMSVFEVFVNKEAEAGPSKLDQFGSLATLFPTDVLEEANKNDHTACPFEEFMRLRESCHELMRSIGGFAYAMRCMQLKSTPSIEVWRKWRMQARAKRINNLLASLGNVNKTLKKTVKSCAEWSEEHPSLAQGVTEALENLIDLQSEQLKHQRGKGRKSTRTELDITVELVEARDLPKGLFGVCNPVVTVQPSWEILKTTPQVKRNQNPQWNLRFHWTNISPQCQFRLVLYDKHSLYRQVLGSASFHLADSIDFSKPVFQDVQLYLNGATVNLRILPHILVEPRLRVHMNVRGLFKSVNRQPMVHPWQTKETEDGRTYFRNQETGAVTVAMDVQKEEARTLPDSQAWAQWQIPETGADTFK